MGHQASTGLEPSGPAGNGLSADELEIESLEQFDHWVAACQQASVDADATGTPHPVTIQGLDLRGRSEALLQVPLRGVVILGGRLPEGIEATLQARGALIFPTLHDLPFDPYRVGLYRADELYDHLDHGYADCLDARTFAWFGSDQQRTVRGTLAMSLHDHAITDALDDLGLDRHRCVGVMGGHAVQRGTPGYREAAELGARLAASGFTVLTGGGPGAMEAANLGAGMTPVGGAVDDALLDHLCARLSSAASFAPIDQGGAGIEQWARAAQQVLREHPPVTASFGLPTWFYGHEPPNLFATGIAKYFSNAIREDELLQRCNAGIIYLPGAAGTVQEVFQAATRNYYAAPGASVAPLILVGREYWTRTLPVWPLLKALGRDRAMGERLALVDDLDELAGVLDTQH